MFLSLMGEGRVGGGGGGGGGGGKREVREPALMGDVGCATMWKLNSLCVYSIA